MLIKSGEPIRESVLFKRIFVPASGAAKSALCGADFGVVRAVRNNRWLLGELHAKPGLAVTLGHPVLCQPGDILVITFNHFDCGCIAECFEVADVVQFDYARLANRMLSEAEEHLRKRAEFPRHMLARQPPETPPTIARKVRVPK